MDRTGNLRRDSPCRNEVWTALGPRTAFHDKLLHKTLRGGRRRVFRESRRDATRPNEDASLMNHVSHAVDRPRARRTHWTVRTFTTPAARPTGFQAQDHNSVPKFGGKLFSVSSSHLQEAVLCQLPSCRGGMECSLVRHVVRLGWGDESDHHP
jgi:hypothetical protein